MDTFSVTTVAVAIQTGALGVVAWGGLVMVVGVRPALLAAQGVGVDARTAATVEGVMISVWRRYDVVSLAAGLLAVLAGVLALATGGTAGDTVVLAGAGILATLFAVKVFEDGRLSSRLIRSGDGTRGAGGALDDAHRTVELLAAGLLVFSIVVFVARVAM